MSYQAPVEDTLFLLKEVAGLELVAALPGFEAADVDTAVPDAKRRRRRLIACKEGRQSQAPRPDVPAGA